MSTSPSTTTADAAARPARTAPGGPSGARLLRQYVLVQLVYNPLITGLVLLALGPADVVRWFVIALTIAAVSSSVAFVLVGFAAAGSQWRRRRGGRALGVAGYFGVALFGLPLGLLAAAAVTERAFGVRVPGSLFDYRFGAFLGVLLAALFLLWQLWRDAKRAALAAELERERSERRGLEAQLAALTAQLNPHLLFNALNTVAALIPTRPAEAEETLLRLADLYRGLLAATRRNEHSLADELAICRSYLDVERARFSDRLTVELEIDERLDPSRLRVPVLVLQPLVENALTHGLADRARGGMVRVAASARERELWLSVLDDGVGLGRSSRRGAGVGIENTRQRLRLRYGDAAALELSSPAAGGTEAVLRLPLEAAR